jgi:hypothetical protein
MAGAPEDGVTVGRGGGGVAAREEGTKGGAAGAGNGDALGAEKLGAPAGLNGGSGGGGVNSGSSDDGDGGVAVAAAVERSIASGLGRGLAGASAVRGAGCAAGRWEEGANAAESQPD